MITQLVVYYILLILKKNYRLIADDLSKQKVLHADSRAIQNNSKITAAAVNTKVINLLHSWTIKTHQIRICKRNKKSFVININGWQK